MTHKTDEERLAEELKVRINQILIIHPQWTQEDLMEEVAKIVAKDFIHKDKVRGLKIKNINNKNYSYPISLVDDIRKGQLRIIKELNQRIDEVLDE